MFEEVTDGEKRALVLGECYAEDLRKYEGDEDAEYFCVNPLCQKGVSCTEETPTGDGIYECQHCGKKITVLMGASCQ